MSSFERYQCVFCQPTSGGKNFDVIQIGKQVSISIDYLANHPHFLPILAEWTYSEWGKFDPDNSLRATIERYEDRLNKDCLPMMLVAYSDSTPIGCVSLKKTEMTIRPNYLPWLGSMYVNPINRGKGGWFAANRKNNI